MPQCERTLLPRCFMQHFDHRHFSIFRDITYCVDYADIFADAARARAQRVAVRAYADFAADYAARASMPMIFDCAAYAYAPCYYFFFFFFYFRYDVLIAALCHATLDVDAAFVEIDVARAVAYARCLRRLCARCAIRLYADVNHSG